MIGAYHDALLRCGWRYKEMVHEVLLPDPALQDFVDEFVRGCEQCLPVPKLCRWLGYIQGVLIERGVTTVEAERDWTRPLFRPLDFA